MSKEETRESKRKLRELQPCQPNLIGGISCLVGEIAVEGNGFNGGNGVCGSSDVDVNSIVIPGGTGIFGKSNQGAGVLGSSNQGAGVVGNGGSNAGPGVIGNGGGTGAATGSWLGDAMTGWSYLVALEWLM